MIYMAHFAKSLVLRTVSWLVSLVSLFNGISTLFKQFLHVIIV